MHSVGADLGQQVRADHVAVRIEGDRPRQATEGGALAADLLLRAIEDGPGVPVETAQTLTVVERRTT